MKRYEGKTVLITGGGARIGSGIAKAFAKEGANVVITEIKEEKLTNVRKTLVEEFGEKILAVVADGTDINAVKNVINKIIQTYGGLNVLINNTQKSKSGLSIIEHSIENFDLLSIQVYMQYFTT